MTWAQFAATMLGLAALAAARLLDRYLPGRDRLPHPTDAKTQP